MPMASQASVRLSAAWLEGAQASARPRSATSERMISAVVRVLPVPGGPLSRLTAHWRAISCASSWRSLSCEAMSSKSIAS